MWKSGQILRFAALLLLVAGIGRTQPEADYFEFAALSSVTATAAHNVGLGGGASGYPTYHTLQLENVGTPATCTIQLEGCVNDPSDSDCWEILSDPNVNCITTKMFHVISRPVRHVRANLTALTGTAATIKTLVQTLVELDFSSHVEWDVTTGFVDSGGNAVYTHTVLQILTELDFATHANWDVTAGFVDSAGNAVYTHLPLEVLTELDFATHANWAASGDMTDTTGAAVYTHSGGTGTLTQASGGFANPMVADVGYVFGYAVTGFTSDVACDITTAIAATTTALTMSNGSQTTTFTAASSPGDFVISCTSASGGVTIDDVTLKRVDHTATLTQASGDFANPGVNSVSYVFGYTISSTTGTPLCDITTAFADSTTALTVTDGAQTTIFTSASSTGDFVISCTSDVVGETATFDDVTLTQVNHSATLTQVDTAYANALVASKLYTFLYAVTNVTGTPVCQITSGQTGASVDLVETNGAQIGELTSSATITDDFVITCSSDTVGETITFDDVSWFEQYAKNLSPIAVTTASAHGYSTGARVTITSAVGNTNANVTDTLITVIDTTNFTLDGTTGNAPWTSGGSILSDPRITAHYLGVR